VRAWSTTPARAALGQVLEAPLTIVADQTTSIALGVEGDRFVIRR
jgi:hypothetical protein